MQKRNETESTRRNELSYLGDFDHLRDYDQETLLKIISIAIKALDEIADPTSAFHMLGRPRNLSYADWELRSIAKITLEQMLETRPKPTSD